MTKILGEAIAEAARLPASDHEQIGRELLVHIDKLRALRGDLSDGIRSLDSGQGAELDISEVIRQGPPRAWRDVVASPGRPKWRVT